MLNKTISTYMDNGPEETYDQWFKRQVKEMIEVASQPNAVPQSNADLMAEVEARRLELISKLKNDD
jgi:hypothetical protein